MPLTVCRREPGFKARCVRLHQSARHVWISLESEEEEHGFSLDLISHFLETPVDFLAAFWYFASFPGRRTPLSVSYCFILHDTFIIGIAFRGVVCSPDQVLLAEWMIQKEVWIVKHGK